MRTESETRAAVERGWPPALPYRLVEPDDKPERRVLAPVLADEALDPVGNVSLLERPVAISTLCSSVRAALRARHARSQGGLGLGLPLVKSLVEMHGGTIVAKSAGEDRGSEFEVRLPLQTEAADGDRSCERADHAEGVEAETDAGETEGSFTVLVVEDNADGRQALTALIEMWGYDTLAAADGREALATAAESPPRLALVDIGLPGMDGYEVARRLRESYPDRDLALVALTGYGQPEDRRRSLDAGFDHHLVKPVDPGQLKELLDRL